MMKKKKMTFRPQPKLIAFRSEPLKAYTRTKHCLRCGSPPPSMAHHESFGLKSLKGTSKKIPDNFVMPLCIGCHDIRGRNLVEFWEGFHDCFLDNAYSAVLYAVLACMINTAEFLSLNKGKKI